jgi:hypothetical protein
VQAAHRAFDAHFDIDGRLATFSDHAGLVSELELHDAPGPLPPPTRAATGLAAAMLAEGRLRAEQLRADSRIAAGAGGLAAIAATLGGRHQTLSRRRLLRTGLSAAGFVALAPGLGYTALAEIFAPDELAAYDRLSARLASVEASLETPIS